MGGHGYAPGEGEERPRPLGVTILAWVFLVGGIGALLSASVGGDHIAAISEGLGIDRVVALGGAALSIFVAINSGIGLLMGVRWGWWFGTFYFVHSALSFVNTGAAGLAFNPDPMLAGGSTLVKMTYVIKLGSRIVVSIFLYWYLLKPHVRAYFGLGQLSLRRIALWQVGLCALLLAVGWLVNLGAM